MNKNKPVLTVVKREEYMKAWQKSGKDYLKTDKAARFCNPFKFSAMFNETDNICVIAEVEGDFAGLCGASVKGDLATLKQTVVLEQFRGSGIATEMILRVIEELKKLGVKKLSAQQVSLKKEVSLLDRVGFQKENSSEKNGLFYHSYKISLKDYVHIGTEVKTPEKLNFNDGINTEIAEDIEVEAEKGTAVEVPTGKFDIAPNKTNEFGNSRADVDFYNTNEERIYRAVINFLRLTCPEMTRSAHKISWKYKKTKRVEVKDMNGEGHEFQATIAVDRKTGIPIGFSGNYYTENNEYGKHSHSIAVYVHPEWRRLGISQTFYTIQEQKMRNHGVKYGYEIQINGNIELSKKMGYKNLSKGRLCKDGTYSQARNLIDATTKDSIFRFDNLEARIKENYLKEFSVENLKIGDYEGKDAVNHLNAPWDKENI